MLLTDDNDEPPDVVSWAMATKGHVSPDVTAATAAFAVAVVGNLWGRLTGHAPIVPILGMHAHTERTQQTDMLS